MKAITFEISEGEPHEIAEKAVSCLADGSADSVFITSTHSISRLENEATSLKIVQTLKESEALCKERYPDGIKAGKEIMCEMPELKPIMPKGNERIEYGKVEKIQRIRMFIAEAPMNGEPEIVNLSAKPDSKNAGAVASRILRTMAVDGRPCAMRFVMSVHEPEAMSDKLLAATRIVRRMALDPGIIIGSSLPAERIGYQALMTLPKEKVLPRIGVEDDKDGIKVSEMTFYLR
jgi:hypothetical protein